MRSVRLTTGKQQNVIKFFYQAINESKGAVLSPKCGKSPHWVEATNVSACLNSLLKKKSLLHDLDIP